MFSFSDLALQSLIQVRTLTFLRHGKADRAASDFDRVLGEAGRDQAAECRMRLESPEFDVVFSSPAPRAIATAAIVSGKPESAIFPINQMYPWPDTDDGAVIDRVFNDLGYAPLSAYLSEPDGQVVSRYGNLVWSVLRDTIGNVEGKVLVSGHAVLSPSIGVAACNGHEGFAAKLREINLGECCGFQIIFDDWKPIGMLEF